MVVVTAIISATGSAKKTAIHLLFINVGIM